MLVERLRVVFRRAVVAVVFLTLVGQTVVRSQQANARLAGTVTTASGTVVGGAEVEAREVATAVSRLTKTDASGRFTFPVLPAGTYDVRVEATGYAPAVQRFTLKIGDSRNASFVIRTAGEAREQAEGAAEGQVRVFEWFAPDRAAFEELLRQPTLDGLLLTHVTPTSENTSLVVFEKRSGGEILPVKVVQVDGALTPAVLARQVADQRKSTLLGVHRVQGASVLVFR